MVPVYLLLENFMSHARSELDFTQFDMALIVGMENGDPDASNGIGKTAIFDAIRWALYGKHRFRTKKRVIKRGKVACSVTFVFQLQNETYRVVRKMSQRAASSEVSLLIQDGTEWRDLSCDTPTATGQKVEDLIRLSHETFVNSICFPQNELLRFAAATANQKKEVLKDSLEIGIWDRYQDKAKEIVRRLSGQVALLDDRIKSFGDIDRDLMANRTAMERLKARMASTQDAIAKHTARLDGARLAASKDSAAERLAAIMAKAAAIKARKQAILSELQDCRALVSNARFDRDTMAGLLLEAARQVLAVAGHPERQKAEAVFRALSTAKRLPSCVVFPDRMEQDRAALRKHQREADDAALKLQHLLALEPGKECPTCLGTIGDIEKVDRRRKKRAGFLENAKREAEGMVAELAKSMSRQEAVLAAASVAASQLGHMEASLSRMDGQISGTEARCAVLEAELASLAEEWRTLREEKARLKAPEEPKEDILQLAGELEGMREELLRMSVEYGNLQGHAEDLERRRSERQTLVGQRPPLAKELDIHNQLVKAFGKGGVPAIIMENVTEDLRNYANEILKLISDRPMEVDFVTQKRTEAGSWNETFDLAVTIDDEVNEFEDLSGGEQVRAAMAVRLALSAVLMRRMGSNVRFLLLDEVDQALDRRGVQALADTLAALSKEFKILVITHNEAMKDRFDHIITVQKGPDGSFLRQ